MKNKAEVYTSRVIKELLGSVSRKKAKRIEKKMLLAAKIEDAMKAKGWRNTDLAKVLQKQPSEITKWLSGTHNFTIDTLWDIQDVLDVELIALEEKREEQVVFFHFSISNAAEVEPQKGIYQPSFTGTFPLSYKYKKTIKGQEINQA